MQRAVPDPRPARRCHSVTAPLRSPRAKHSRAAVLQSPSYKGRLSTLPKIRALKRESLLKICSPLRLACDVRAQFALHDIYRRRAFDSALL